MCGINFILSKKEGSLKNSIAAMQQANEFRGPDASNSMIHKHADWHMALGVNRLKVIDQDEASNQPMVSECGNYILAFNGEVYNYQDLKNQLIGKYTFRSRSDTEAILYWLIDHGAEGLKDLKGMFALVYIDLKSRDILITRDKHGIIPFFIYQVDNEIIVSSSISGIEKSKRANLSLNETAVEEYLAFRHVMGSMSFYNEIRSVVPGEVLLIDSSFNCTKSSIVENTIQDQRSLKEILLDSLSLFKESYDQPGILLSGGVDSTLLLALLNRELGEKELKTYTLDTGPDAQWAKKAAEQYGAHHLEIPVNAEILKRTDEYFVNMDQPVGDHGAFAVWLVAEQAAKDSNVLLSGAGADELFGGYNRHRAFHFYLNNKNALILYKEFAKKTGTRAILPKNVKSVIKNVEKNPGLTYLNFLQIYAINKIENPNHQYILPGNIDDALKFDRKNYLVNDVLAISNNSGMQHNLEVRVPYLFDDVVHKAAAISIEQKMKHKGKGPLKDILTRLEGEPYTRRKKMGFGLPLEEWFRNANTAWIWGFLEKDNPIFKYVPQPRILEMIRLHQAGKRDYHMELWSILVLAKWLKRKL